MPVRSVVRDYERWGRYSSFKSHRRPKSKSSEVPASTSEVELVTNVFPGSSPAIAGADGEMLLLWEYQDLADSVLQSTEIAWSRFGDGMPPVSDVPVSIIDNTTVTSEMIIDRDVELTDLRVLVEIEHTFVGDLHITLTSPSGIEVILLNDPSCSDNDMLVTFDDDAITNLESHCAGTVPWYEGGAVPYEYLSIFDGEHTRGTWTLSVTDTAQIDTGTILDWQLIAEPSLDEGWSTPALIVDDTRVELNPVAAQDDAGKIVAAWTRINAPAFDDSVLTDIADLPLFYNELDVVTAAFDLSSQTWSTPVAVTSDEVMDTELRMAQDQAGNLLLTWVKNPGGEFMSTAENPSSIASAFWDSSAEAWESPIEVVSNVTGLIRYDAAVNGSSAFVVFERDPDGALSGDRTLELFTFDGSSWSFEGAFAPGGVDDILPTVTYDSTGEGHVVWIRGGNLVHATLSDPTPVTIRPASTSVAFQSMELLTNSAGNITLLWEEVVDNGPANLFAMIFDPVSSTFSEDRRLTEDSWLAKKGRATYGADGLLRIPYTATEIVRRDVDVDLNGETVTIPNIPEHAQTDLRLLEHSLIVDLAVDNDDLAINPASPNSGDSVSASVTVHNAGDFPVSAFVVDLYVGEPSGGGVLVGTTTVPGPFAAGAAADIQFIFTFPTIDGDIVAVIDAGGDVTELLEDNNVARHYSGNEPPEAWVIANVVSGEPPLTVTFDGRSSTDPEGDAMTFGWAFGDGTDSKPGPQVTHTFENYGQYPVTLAVTDEFGAVGTATVVISVWDIHTLAVAIAGDGTGSVTSSPPGIDCGANCAEEFGHDTVVTLISSPGAGSVFSGWSGDPDCSDGEITIDADTGCAAIFYLDSTVIFTDDFETGDASAWSRAAP